MVINKMYILRPTAPRKAPINMLPRGSMVEQLARRSTMYADRGRKSMVARTAPRKAPINMLPRGSMVEQLARRSTMYADRGRKSMVARTRPLRPPINMTVRPTAIGGATSLTRPTGGIAGIVPTALTARPPQAGITSAGAPTGGLGLGLAGIGSDIQATGSGIVNTAKSLIPTAVKVVAAVLVFKIVLWLIRGRR